MTEITDAEAAELLRQLIHRQLLTEMMQRHQEQARADARMRAMMDVFYNNLFGSANGTA